MKLPIILVVVPALVALQNPIALVLVKLNKASIVRFSDGEFEPSFDETVRGSEVFLIQSTMPPAENILELLMKKDYQVKLVL